MHSLKGNTMSPISEQKLEAVEEFRCDEEKPETMTLTLESRLESWKELPLTEEERQRFRGFPWRLGIRLIGSIFGYFWLLFFLTYLFTGKISASLEKDSWLAEFADSCFSMFGLCLVFWVAIWGASKFLDQPVSAAIYAKELKKASTAAEKGMNRMGAVFILNRSGAFARSFFRSVTGRRFNMSVRPDLKEYVLQISARTMLPTPLGGPDELCKNPAPAIAYGKFLQEVVDLLVIQRIHLIEKLADEYNFPAPEMTDELEQYLHPLARSTRLDVFAKYALPLFAVSISIWAILR